MKTFALLLLAIAPTLAFAEVDHTPAGVVSILDGKSFECSNTEALKDFAITVDERNAAATPNRIDAVKVSHGMFAYELKSLERSISETSLSVLYQNRAAGQTLFIAYNADGIRQITVQFGKEPSQKIVCYTVQ